MSREIKFRAWNKKLKCWGGGISINKYGVAAPAIQRLDVKRRGDVYEIMQFTGLLDKNGKEIYEGDIFESPDLWNEDTGFPADKPSGKMLRGFIDWGDYGHTSCHTAYGWFMNTKESEEKYGWQTPGIDDVESLEVIGNIYENPELLE